MIWSTFPTFFSLLRPELARQFLLLIFPLRHDIKKFLLSILPKKKIHWDGRQKNKEKKIARENPHHTPR